MLCPIIAQGKVDQAKFYELFDQYWVQVMQPWQMPIAETNSDQAKNNISWLRWVFVLLVLAGMGYAVHLLTKVTDPPPLKASFRNPNKVKVGDTVRFENLSENIDSLCIFQWEIFDDFAENEPNTHQTTKPEFTTTDSFHLTYPISQMGKSPFKKVKLTSIHPVKKDTAVFESTFTILCNNMPKIDSVVAANEAKVGEIIDFKAFIKKDETLKVSWDMGDTPSGEETVLQTGTAIRHAYQNEGQFQIRLNVVREGAQGYCQVDTFFTIKIGGEKAYLASKFLQKDNISAIVNFSYGLWILMGLLGIFIIWFWVKWASRPVPIPPGDESNLDLESAALRFKSADKAPYKIPFRSHNGFVQVDKDLYRLADVMRQRQEGLRKEMDVPTSVNKTIAGGGFPQLLTKADEVPTEFLFLIDSQVEGSHQRHLFQWIVGFLQQREVLGEAFFFNESLQRFWNSHFPEGISNSQLQRMYGFHKLIVISDGHQFIDNVPNFEKQRPKLRPIANELFGHWRQRFLLTPTPVVSWTYREGVLHDRFAIFPLDTKGLNAFIKYLEHEIEDEERPPYKMWSSKLLENRQEADINYRSWRSADDHRAYLKDHPNLYKWLSAIALYPKPEWDMTLAIGRALLPVGVDVTYDNLLILSRVPWLINGDLSPNLRHQLIDSLDKETEQLARQAIEAELESVGEIVKDGHANLEHQTNLTLQQFALDPTDPTAQKGIHQLMALGLLTPRHFVEINQSISRHQVGRQQSAQARTTAMDRNAESVKVFLEENKKQPEPLKKPFFTGDFYWASVLSLLYLILFLFAWDYGGTDKLANWAGIDVNDSTDCQDEYSHLYFLKKECIADSAVLFNNQAVGIWENMAGDATEKTLLLVREVNQMKLALADSLFDQAIALRPNYDIAISNKEKLNYNIGVQEYHAYLADSSDVNGLQKAKEYFDKIKLDSFKLDAMHGKGLVNYYTERSLNQQPNISQNIYSQIMLQDSLYFNKIETYPHLQSLLAIRKNVALNIIDKDTKLPIADVLITDKKGNRFRTNNAGRVELEMVLGERRFFDFNKKGYETLNTEIIDSSGVNVYKIEIKKLPEEVVAVNPGNLPKGDIEFCYVVDGKFLKGYFSIDYQLISERNVVPMRQFISYDSDPPIKSFQVKAIAKNLTLALPNHASNYEIDFYISQEFNGANENGFRVEARDYKLTSGGTTEINFSYSNTGRFENINALIIGVVKNKNCNVDYKSSGDKDIESGCVVGIAFHAKPFYYQGSRAGQVNEEYLKNILAKEDKKIALNLQTLSCTWADKNIVQRGEEDFESELENIFKNLETKRDDDGDGVPNYQDQCPTEKGIAQNNGCPEKPNPNTEQAIPTTENNNWQLIKSNFIAEPKILKNRDYFDTFNYGGYEYKIILNELTEKGTATFTIEKDLKQEARYIAPVTLSDLQTNEKIPFKMDGINFQLEYKGQERMRVNALMRDVTLYSIYSDGKGSLDPFEINEPKPDLDRLLKELESNMVFVKGGNFQMGCDPKRDGECKDEELPLHEVALSDFYIGKYEVTQELWGAVMGENPSRFKDCPNCPVENVNWEDAQNFIGKINQLTGAKYRLPTEAEWEYAARGGNRSANFKYPGSNDKNSVAWDFSNTNQKTHPIGNKQPNELGLYDMGGNVGEWCSDWFGQNYYGSFPKGMAQNPSGPLQGDMRIIRGGGWMVKEQEPLMSTRHRTRPNLRVNDVGFRLAKD